MAWYTVTTGSMLYLWRQSLTPGCMGQWEVEVCPDWWPSLLTAQAFQRINTSKTKLICLQSLNCLSHPWAECSLSCFSCRSLFSEFIKGRSWRIRLVENELLSLKAAFWARGHAADSLGWLRSPVSCYHTLLTLTAVCQPVPSQH